MTQGVWERAVFPPERDGECWELFHENSKLGRYAPFPGDEAVVQQMRVLHEALPYPAAPAVPLPKARTPAARPLDEAILARQTARGMRPAPLPLASLATLLHLAYGITRSNQGTGFPRPFRVVPSGGALYPLEIYFHAAAVQGLRPGLYHYSPHAGQVELVREGDHAGDLASLLVQGEIAHQASVVFFVTALPERGSFKYGDRGYRFALLEAGHVAQNLSLVSTALELAAVCLGGFFDREVDAWLGLNGITHSTLYMMAVGEPAE